MLIEWNFLVKSYGEPGIQADVSSVHQQKLNNDKFQGCFHIKFKVPFTEICRYKSTTFTYQTYWTWTSYPPYLGHYHLCFTNISAAT